ncbi:MAG: sensor histidine kinase [Erysipelotrichaceae bacterium]|nr:sensor histidine kinase [Erysipelotrichaceae bacterium]
MNCWNSFLTVPRIIYNLLLTIAVLYSNSALRFTSEQVPEQIIEFSILSIILQISLLICFIVLEKVLYENRVRLEESERRHAAEVLLKNTMEKEKADQELRKYRHDMKNHLSALSYLIEKKETGQALNYLRNLSIAIPESNLDIKTDNLVLDALLSQKFNEARRKNIDLTMRADLKPLLKLDDHDLCIIFGNALDNAINAAEKNGDDPFISIRSEEKAGYYLLSFENNYKDTIIIEDDELISTKKDKNNHGFGIGNIKAVVKRYNGYVRYHVNDEKKRFTLILALPLN